MSKDTLQWIVVLGTALLVAVGGIKLANDHKKAPQAEPPVVQVRPPDPIPPKPEPPKNPAKPQITNKTPAYLDYGKIVDQLKEWNQQAPDLTEIGTYGKSARGTDIYYIRVRNKLDTQPKPKVMITACIHGNEPWCTGVVMAYIGNMLGSYGENKEITDLINSRDIYFVPVVSPDSYPHSRHVDGVDPNRDFPGPSNPNKKSTPSVKAVQTFFQQIKPNAVISGHTHGRVFLTPYGDRNQVCPNEPDYQRIMTRVADMCNYRLIRACQMYGHPIHGSEVDWYYRNGAFSVVMEFGTHQRKPTHEEIKSEFARTYRGVLHFVTEAPLVQIKSDTLAPDASESEDISHRLVPPLATVFREASPQPARFCETSTGLGRTEWTVSESDIFQLGLFPCPQINRPKSAGRPWACASPSRTACAAGSSSSGRRTPADTAWMRPSGSGRAGAVGRRI